jgi:hypothetical protein
MSGRFKNQKSRFFAAEKSIGNCGKEISFTLHQLSEHGKPKNLVFTDIVYPSDSPAAKMTRCPN